MVDNVPSNLLFVKGSKCGVYKASDEADFIRKPFGNEHFSLTYRS